MFRLLFICGLLASTQLWASQARSGFGYHPSHTVYAVFEKPRQNFPIQMSEVDSKIIIGPNHLRHRELKQHRSKGHEGRANGQESRANGQERQGISEEAAVRIARQHVPGKVLGVKLRPRHGLYMVKMMTGNAKIRVVKVNRTTGQVTP